ncbi:hypothetical protein [Angelakisella massiliensis]|uniref:hypothetical protein n=1 Tax=Angelakisella massiliensis TaxID=1871018 RepID=UPI0023A857D7|nr:hypothetical protein [Angelakisella massiliensis]
MENTGHFQGYSLVSLHLLTSGTKSAGFFVLRNPWSLGTKTARPFPLVGSCRFLLRKNLFYREIMDWKPVKTAQALVFQPLPRRTRAENKGIGFPKKWNQLFLCPQGTEPFLALRHDAFSLIACQWHHARP